MHNEIYKSIIWLRLDSIGDAILSSSMLPHVKNKFREASITVVCQEHVAELYEACPFVRNVIKVPFDCKFKKGQLQNTIQRIRDTNPDLLLNSVFSRHHLATLPGLEFVPKSFSFRWRNTTDIVSSGGQWEPELLKHRRFLMDIGIQSPLLQPQAWLSSKDKITASTALKDANDKFLVLFAGVRTKERIYSDYWKALRGLDYFVVALGSQADYDVNQEQLDKSQCDALNLSGKLSLRESIAVIELARLVIGGETGLAHAACAVGTQNVILLGGGHYGRFMPYSSLTTVVDNRMDCFKCNWSCGINFECITGINPLKIRKAIDEVLVRRQG